MKRCLKCILPESYPGILFHEDGICNYCRGFSKKKLKEEKALIKIVEPFRNKAKYDCITGLSGGRDSTFLAHYVVKKLHLNPLAVTFDNGFMPEQTRENINNTVKKLCIDHHFVKKGSIKNNVKRVMSFWMRSPSPATISLLCTGCTTGVMQAVTKTAYENNISLVFWGAGEPEGSFAQKLMRFPRNNEWKKLSLISGFVINYGKSSCNVSSIVLLPTFFKEFYYRFLFKFNKQLKIVNLFRFRKWNEEEICSVIQNDLNWEKPEYIQTTWRADCKVHLLKEYLYKKTLGFTKNDELLSGMIRENLIARKEALSRLQHDNYISRPFLTSFLYELGFEIQKLDTVLAHYKKSRRL